MLADVLARICSDAGHHVYGCDTHGLAQRHGLVVSHLRLNQDPCTPRIPPGEAHLVLALERLEAYRAVQTMLVPGGGVFYYDAVYQPIAVRLGEAVYPSAGQIEAAAAARGGWAQRVADADLPDPRMQNIALLARLASEETVERVTTERVRAMLETILPPRMLETNLAVFDRGIEHAREQIREHTRGR